MRIKKTDLDKIINLAPFFRSRGGVFSFQNLLEGRRVAAMKAALIALLMCLFLFSGCALMDSVTWVIDGNEKKD